MTDNVRDRRWLSTGSERRAQYKPANERAYGEMRLGRILGIEIRLDTSWFIVFILISWSLAGHRFPTTHPGWTTWTYGAMGVVTALLFFASVVAHELAHSIVSQATGVPVRHITLFIFGGVAHISHEPRRARDEFLMALAGPLTSLAIAALFGLLWLVSPLARGPLHALAGWLAWINVSLAVFNLIPGFPLDGGRVLRAIIWSVTGNMRRATRIAAGLGRLVAYGFILWGIWQILGGNWANGVWVAFIGWFLQSAAKASYQELVSGELPAIRTAGDVMMTVGPRIPRGLTLDVVVDQIVLPGGRRCYPVVENGQLQGLLTLQHIKRVPREQQAITRVDEVMIPWDQLRPVEPGDKLEKVFEQMTLENMNQVPVMKDGLLLGMVAQERVLASLQFRAELGK